MKKLFKVVLSLICLLNISIQAKSLETLQYVSFSCTMPEDSSVHRFAAIGYAEINDKGEVQGNISLQLIKGNEIRSVLQFNDVSAAGTFEGFEATPETKAFSVMNLETSIPYIRSMSLIFKDAPLASSILSIDYFNYRSNCKITK